MASKQSTVRVSNLQSKLDQLLISAANRGYSKRALVALAVSVVASHSGRQPRRARTGLTAAR